MSPSAAFPCSFVAPAVQAKKTIIKGKQKIHSERNVTVTLEYSAGTPGNQGNQSPARLTFVTDRPCFPTLGNARRLEVDRPKLFLYSAATAEFEALVLPVAWMSVKAPVGLSVMFAFAHSDLVLRDRFLRLLMDFFNGKDLRFSPLSETSTPAATSTSAGAPVPESPQQQPQFAYKDSTTPNANGSATTTGPTTLPPQRTRTRSAHSAEVALAAFHSSSSSSSPSRPAPTPSYLGNPLKRPASPTRLPLRDLHDPIGGSHPTASKRSRPNDNIPMGPPRPPPPPPLSSLSTLTNGRSAGAGYPLSPTPSSAAASLLGLSKPSSGAMGAMQQFKHQTSTIKQPPATRRVAQGLTRPAPYSSPMLSAPLAVPGAPGEPAANGGGGSSYFEASRSRTGRGKTDTHEPHHPIATRGRRGKRNGRGGRANGAFVSEFGDGPVGRAGGMGAGVVAEISGMRNNGNTCYQNALLVAFLATCPFMSIISRLAPIDRPLPPDLEGPFVSDLGGGTRSRPRSASVPPRSPSPSKDLMDAPMDTRSEGGRDEATSKGPARHELVKAIAAIAWKRERNPGQVIDPRPFTEGLLNLSGLFKRGEQADAQELLTECLAIMESESPPIGPNAVNLFQFTLAKRVQCDNCPYHSTMTEPHRGLSLEVPPSASSVAPPPTSMLLQQYFAPERIEYKCERCKHPTASVKHFVHRPPQVLVLHLKRFQMMATGQVRKKHESVAIQEVVDLAPFAVPTGGELSSPTSSSSSTSAALHPPPTPHSTTSSTGPPATPTILSTAASPTSTPLKFKLTAVVNHLGQQARRGHYVCDMRDPGRQDHWLTFDDSHVSRLGPMSQLTHRRGQAGYLLFYVAEGTGEVPFGGSAIAAASTPVRVQAPPGAARHSPQMAQQLRPVVEIPPMRTPSPSARARAAAGAAAAARAGQHHQQVRPDEHVPAAEPATPSRSTRSTRSKSPRKPHAVQGEQVGSPMGANGPADGGE